MSHLDPRKPANSRFVRDAKLPPIWLTPWANSLTHPQPQGFLAVPPTGKGPGVLVLHAWWGLNDTMKAFCTRLFESGFMAFAPDLYHGKVADNIADAEALGKALDANHLQANAEIADATRFLNERVGQAGRGLAVIGFSLGAYYALDLAAADPEHIRSVVIFYGTGGADFGNSRAAYLGHFAGGIPKARWPPGDFLSPQWHWTPVL